MATFSLKRQGDVDCVQQAIVCNIHLFKDVFVSMYILCQCYDCNTVLCHTVWPEGPFHCSSHVTRLGKPELTKPRPVRIWTFRHLSVTVNISRQLATSAFFQ